MNTWITRGKSSKIMFNLRFLGQIWLSSLEIELYDVSFLYRNIEIPMAWYQTQIKYQHNHVCSQNIK